MLNCLFKAKPRKDGSKNVVNETGFRRNTRIKMRSFCRFCRFAFANHSDVCFPLLWYFSIHNKDWRSLKIYIFVGCRRILTHLQIIQSPSSQCSSSSQELQRESPPRPVGTEQAQRICQQVKSASFKHFGRPGLPIFLRSPFAFHFLCQFSSLLLPFVFDLIQEFPFCSERLGLLASNPSGQHEETDPASKFEVEDEVWCEKVLGWFQLQGFVWRVLFSTSASQANDATTQSSYNFSWRNKTLPHDKSLASHIILHCCVLVTRSSPCFRQPTVWGRWCRLSLQSFQSLTHLTRLY